MKKTGIKLLVLLLCLMLAVVVVRWFLSHYQASRQDFESAENSPVGTHPGSIYGLPQEYWNAMVICTTFLHDYEQLHLNGVEWVDNDGYLSVTVSDLQPEAFQYITLVDGSENSTDRWIEILLELDSDERYWDFMFSTVENKFLHLIVSSQTEKVVGYLFP